MSSILGKMLQDLDERGRLAPEPKPRAEALLSGAAATAPASVYASATSETRNRGVPREMARQALDDHDFDVDAANTAKCAAM